MLAYYVEWHMRRALAPLLFADEELQDKTSRPDPVAPQKPSAKAMAKKASHHAEDGLEAHSFDTLLMALATQCKNTCRVNLPPQGRSFESITEPTTLQRRAYQLLGL
jgi:hypothetical protein